MLDMNYLTLDRNAIFNLEYYCNICLLWIRAVVLALKPQNFMVQ